MKRFLIILAAAVLLCSLFSGCGAMSSSTSASPSSAYTSASSAPGNVVTTAPYASYAPSAEPPTGAPSYGVPSYAPAQGTYNTEEYDTLIENGFISVMESPVSTFSADVDTASYCNIRRMINSGYQIGDIPAGAIRTEEMLNYFSYDYQKPAKGSPFGMTACISMCPWNEMSQLLVFGITTQDFDYDDIGGCNYVFLIDTSGSMDSADKLDLLKEALLELLGHLHDRDRISIVTYSGSYSVLAEGEYGDDRNHLKRIIESLNAGGSTNGGDALLKAYELAEEYKIPYGVNRIIMCSDGDLNVGITSQSDLHNLVSEKRKSGVYLSVLGFGTGNYSDSRMQTLADNGNGNYYYIDSVTEAEKVLCDELVSTLITVAEDVKLQIEFNPKYVQEYRQIGYESRLLDTEDFNNDSVDAGEVGSGCCLTFAYEIIPVNTYGEAGTSELKYQTSGLTEAAESGEWMTVSIRYKEPGQDESQRLDYPIGYREITDDPSQDWRFAASVCEFAMILHNSPYKGSSTIWSVMNLLESWDVYLDPYKAEFAGLVEKLAS